MATENGAPNEELTLEGVQTQVLASLEEIRSDWKSKWDEVTKLGADHGDFKKEITLSVENALRRMDEAVALIKNPQFVNSNPVTGGVKSIGEMVAENKSVREWFGEGRAEKWDGRGKIFMPIQNLDLGDGQKAGTFFPNALLIAQAWVPELKTTITTGTVGSGTSGVLMPTRIPGIVAPPQPQIRVRDLIPRLPTTANAIDWVKESSMSEVVSPQTEASAKGESEINFTVDTETVRLIATWIPASRQVLDDFVGLQAYINMRLIDALMNEEDDQILRGDDTGQNLKGLSQAATAYDDATYDQTGDTELDKLMRMQTQLHAGNYTPSGYILHPTDWDNIRTLKADYGGGTGTGPYILGGPGGNSGNQVTDMVWGIPVATTTRMTADQAFCGAFSQFVVLWDRMQSRVDISTEHASYFVENLVAIRAEERLCLTVRDNNAIVYESGLA
jgi:HK97 family phage major capsid protein